MEDQKGSKKLIVSLVAILVVVILVLGVALYFLYIKKDEAPTSNEKKKEQVVSEGALGSLKELDELMVNLQSGTGKKSILKMKVNLELSKMEDGSEEQIFSQYKPVIFDVFYTIVSQRSREDLSSVGGKEDLKEALKEELNRVLPTKIVKNIYWRTFIIQ